MNRLASNFAVWSLAALLMVCLPHQTNALGLSGLRVKAGVNLTREQQFSQLQGLGGQFDSHRWMLGSNLDLGSLILPKLHFVPGVDFVVEEKLRVYVINTDFVYFFSQSPKGRGYAGAGFGTHLYRPTATGVAAAAAVGASAQSDTKISLNVPIGYQHTVGAGLAWFGEVKLVIADDEQDSALQFSVGFNFGSNE